MKVVCIVPLNPVTSNASGEMKKFLMQKKALEKNGLITDVQYLKPVLGENQIYEKIARRFLTYRLYSSADAEYICANCVDANAIYIRKEKIDGVFICMLKEIRRTCPNAKIILEIPTYPYDKEFSRIVDRPYLWKEKWYRRFFRYYVDRIVILSNEDRVFGVKCIKIDNGFDCDCVPLQHEVHFSGKQIRLIGVASLAQWHGYDRLIQGLGKYYKGNPDRKVEFHIVGDGAVVKDLKKLCRDLDVEQYVFFHGWMHGKELDDIFDQCDIGVGSLGMYRIGLQSGSTLKLREYTARGIPFLYGYTDSLIRSCVEEYTLQVSNDDSPIDINNVISFYDKMAQIGFDNVAKEMRRLAEKNLSWEQQMKPVVDYILSDSQ